MLELVRRKSQLKPETVPLTASPATFVRYCAGDAVGHATASTGSRSKSFSLQLIVEPPSCSDS